TGSGGGGLGGAISSALKAVVKHDGGLISDGGHTRQARPEWFRNAVRYHTGGVVGLKPNEMPAILQRGEEVLTANDPRHINNGGGAEQPVIINAVDGSDMLERAMRTRKGQRVIMNFIRENKAAIG